MNDKDKVKMLEFYFLQVNMLNDISTHLEKNLQEYCNDDETKKKLCKIQKNNCEMMIHLKNIYKEFIFDS